MGLSNYAYRLKAKAGDSAPVDEKGISGPLVGGTIALVDRGSGDWAWRFSAGQAITTFPPRAISPNAAGGGVTVALTIKIVNYGTLDFDLFTGIGTSAFAPTATEPGTGLTLARKGAGDIDVWWHSEQAHLMTTKSIPAGTEVTMVMRMGTQKSTTYSRVDIWHKTTGRSGTAPDQVGGLMTPATTALNTLVVDANNGAIFEIKDYVIWNEELTDADSAAVADNLSAALTPAADTTAPTLTSSAVANATPTVVNLTMSEVMNAGFVPAASAFAVSGHTVSSVAISGSTINLTVSSAFVNGEAARTVTYTKPGANMLQDATGNQTASFGPSSVTNNIAALTTGTFVTDAWTNNAGTLRGAVAVSYTWVSLGRIGSLTGKTLTEGTGTLSAGGVLTATGLPAGAGFLIGAVLGAGAISDAVFYQAGTVS